MPGADGQERVRHRRSGLVLAQGEERDRANFVHYRIARQLLQGGVELGEPPLIVARLEQREPIVKELRRLFRGSRLGRQLDRCSGSIGIGGNIVVDDRLRVVVRNGCRGNGLSVVRVVVTRAVSPTAR